MNSISYQDNIFVVVRKHLEEGTYNGTILNSEVRSGKLYFTIALHDNGRLFMPAGFSLTLKDDSYLYCALKDAGYSDDEIQGLDSYDFIDLDLKFSVENEDYSSHSICNPIKFFIEKSEVSE